MEDVVQAGLIWGSLTSGLTVEEDDDWLKCEVGFDVSTKGDKVPTFTHMAQVTLIKRGLAQYVVTTNLDGLYRKAGLQAHDEVCFLHGDTYTERCTRCRYDFERNYHVRNKGLHVHDHHVGCCAFCGSSVPGSYTGQAKHAKTGSSGAGFHDNLLVGVTDEDVGTKDTHINFGEYLDNTDLEEASLHCAKADLCIVMGTSMSLRHITHFPFQARKTVIVNLQEVPDDSNDNKGRIALRIYAQCDRVCEGLLQRLGLRVNEVPTWLPRDAVPPDQLPPWLSACDRLAAVKRWEECEVANVVNSKSANT